MALLVMFCHFNASVFNDDSISALLTSKFNYLISAKVKIK